MQKDGTNQTEADLLAGRHLKVISSNKHSLSDAINKYIDSHINYSLKSSKDKIRYLQWWQNEIGVYTIVDITASLIIECRNKLTSQITTRNQLRSNTTSNHYVKALSHVFTVLSKEWEWSTHNPFHNITNLKEKRGRVRYLDKEERDKLLEECRNSQNKYLYIIVVLCISTGARKNEILKLTWDNIDLDRKMIILNNTKNKERRSLPLVGMSFDMLLNLYKSGKPQKHDYLFPNSTANGAIDIRSSWETAVRNSAIMDFKFHDLRHCAASYLAMNGATLTEIAAILGHKTLAMVKRYTHLSEQHVSTIVTKMNNNIFGEKSSNE